MSREYEVHLTAKTRYVMVIKAGDRAEATEKAVQKIKAGDFGFVQSDTVDILKVEEIIQA